MLVNTYICISHVSLFLSRDMRRSHGLIFWFQWRIGSPPERDASPSQVSCSMQQGKVRGRESCGERLQYDSPHPFSAGDSWSLVVYRSINTHHTRSRNRSHGPTTANAIALTNGQLHFHLYACKHNVSIIFIQSQLVSRNSGYC